MDTKLGVALSSINKIAADMFTRQDNMKVKKKEIPVKLRLLDKASMRKKKLG